MKLSYEEMEAIRQQRGLPEQPSPYSVGYAVSKGWLPQQAVPTQQELAQAIRGLFDVMRLHMPHDPKVVEAVKRASELVRRVPS